MEMSLKEVSNPARRHIPVLENGYDFTTYQAFKSEDLLNTLCHAGVGFGCFVFA